jgi:hypothetical protein
MGKLDQSIIINRLAKIKYLYKIGIEQTKQNGAFAGFSILAFHDSAEMFLLLVAENNGKKGASKLSFMEFWSEFPELTMSASMERLKDRRVSLKHHGLFPSASDIEESRITITQFLRENTIKQFGEDFESISLADLIEFSNIKEYVKKAESFLAENNIYECLCNTRVGFEELLSTYESDKMQWYRSILNIGERIDDSYKNVVSSKDVSKSRWFNQVTKTTNALRDVLKISALGIDYKKYALFCFITPSYTPTCSPTGERGYILGATETLSIKPEDCQFCIDFVIDSALKLQEFNFDINRYIKRQS